MKIKKFEAVRSFSPLSHLINTPPMSKRSASNILSTRNKKARVGDRHDVHDDSAPAAPEPSRVTALRSHSKAIPTLKLQYYSSLKLT